MGYIVICASVHIDQICVSVRFSFRYYTITPIHGGVYSKYITIKVVHHELASGVQLLE